MSRILLNKYLDLIRNDINRKTLVTIACKIKIPGFTNHFNRPYVRKAELKKMIYNNLKGIRRNKSTSYLNQNAGKRIRRTKSESDLTRKEFLTLSSMSEGMLNPIDSYTKVLPKVPRIVAIGDLHGDLRVTVRALKLSGVIPINTPEDNNINIKGIPWIGGNTVVVQLGDQIDMVRPTYWENNIVQDEIHNDEGSDLKIINFLDILNIKARKQGGAVISVLGNHELMNVDGDFRYVSIEEFSEFGEIFSNSSKNNYSSNKYPYGYKERKNAFKPGGVLARRLALTRYSVVQVGSWIFVHGGITPKLAESYSINEINMYVSEWLKNNRSSKVLDAIDDLYRNDNDDFSPFWSRLFSDHDYWNESKNLYLFNKTMELLNNNNNNNNKIVGMVIGHSPQYMWNKGINSSFENRLWRVDVGMSRAFGEKHESRKYRRVQVLEILNDNNFRIIAEK